MANKNKTGAAYDYLGLRVEILHLSFDEIEVWISGDEIQFDCRGRVEWHLTRCPDCKAVAKNIVGAKVLYVRPGQNGTRIVDVDQKLLREGFTRDGISITS